MVTVPRGMLTISAGTVAVSTGTVTIPRGMAAIPAGDSDPYLLGALELAVEVDEKRRGDLEDRGLPGAAFRVPVHRPGEC
jgi:hypothetical protein